MDRRTEELLLRAVIRLAFEIVRRLIDAQWAQGELAQHPKDLPDLPAYQMPNVFRANGALSHASRRALGEAAEGHVHESLNELSRLTTIEGPWQARWLAQTVRTAYYIHPDVAVAALMASQRALGLA